MDIFFDPPSHNFNWIKMSLPRLVYLVNKPSEIAIVTKVYRKKGESFHRFEGFDLSSHKEAKDYIAEKFANVTSEVILTNKEK